MDEFTGGCPTFLFIVGAVGLHHIQATPVTQRTCPERCKVLGLGESFVHSAMMSCLVCMVSNRKAMLPRIGCRAYTHVGILCLSG